MKKGRIHLVMKDLESLERSGITSSGLFDYCRYIFVYIVFGAAQNSKVEFG